jgi:hypothetical protein
VLDGDLMNELQVAMGNFAIAHDELSMEIGLGCLHFPQRTGKRKGALLIQELSLFGGQHTPSLDFRRFYRAAASVTVAAGEGAVFTAVFLTGTFFAAFAGTLFTAAFLAADFFRGGADFFAMGDFAFAASAARLSAHRFFVAAAIAARPAAESFRFALGG